VERHRDDPVEPVERLSQPVCEGEGEMATQVVQPAELEPLDYGVEGRPVGPEREQAVKGGWPLAAGAAAISGRRLEGIEWAGADRAGCTSERSQLPAAGGAEA
jgi:hypothetical protein